MSTDEELMQSDEEVTPPAETEKEEETDPVEPVFQPGDVVVISQDFHSAYFRGLVGVVDGPGRKGATADTLYRLKIDVPPHHTLIPAKYLQLESKAGAAGATGGTVRSESKQATPPGHSPGQAKGSFWSRLFKR